MAASQEKITEKRSLRDFTRLVLAFFGSLTVLAIYQNLRLYALGVLDGLIGKSFFLLLLHHLGYVALTALVLSFVYKFLERKRSGMGFRIIGIVLLLLLLTEGVLIEFYVNNYEILGPGFLEVYSSRTSLAEFFVTLAVLFPICFGTYYVFYRISSSTYKIIGRMYPFTIILFSLFLATLYSDKKPINENKTQHLVVHAVTHALDMNKYEGPEEFPLLKAYQANNDLGAYFDLKQRSPNLVFVIVEGLGSDFVGGKALYPGLTPFLDSISSTSSLNWKNHLSNTGEGHASLATILGSLPFGDAGFNMATGRVNRNTILGILKKNGYHTSFYYGGNTALNQWDKFLFEDRIDHLLDVKGFGDAFKKQDEDAAGISLGYPDMELFRKWETDHLNYQAPFVEVFFTLSTKRPFQIPDQEKYISKAEKTVEKMKWSGKKYKIFRKNKEIFASVAYADEALASFFRKYQSLPEYQNSIFVITGSHNLTDLPQYDDLNRYKVPLIIHSPLLKKSKEFTNLVSHADILPSVLGLLKTNFGLKCPENMSFIGSGLADVSLNDSRKKIPLHRHKDVVDFIYDHVFIRGGNYSQIKQDLTLAEMQEDFSERETDSVYKKFKAINRYVTQYNKLIPEEELLFARTAREPTKQEMIWINSVFNGSDFDNAYQTARALALNGDYNRALLLGSYILNEVPGHADTEILMGRIHAWSGDYERAAEILEGAILKYPVYTDAYSALLDVYFWSGNSVKAIQLQQRIKMNRLSNEELEAKLKRALRSSNEKERSVQAIKGDDQIMGEQSVAINKVE